MSAVAPAPSMLCTFTPVNNTVGLPPTPEETNVGANTAFVPAPQDGADPVPPETTACPAVVGTHSHAGVTAPHAAGHTHAKTAAMKAATPVRAHIYNTPSRFRALPMQDDTG